MQVTQATRDQDVERDREIARYRALEATGSRDLQALVELAAQIFGVPGAAINLVTSTSQHAIATVGVEPAVCSRQDSMCAVVLDEPQIVVVPDTTRDDCFADNPFVTGELADVRFYASAPLLTPEGVPLGRLCVFDVEPASELPATETFGGPATAATARHEALTLLAERVMDVLALRLQSRRLEDSLTELISTHDELRRSNEALEDFASQVGHDLRNPLMVVSSNAELLAGEPAVAADPELTAMVEDVADASRRMNRMIGQILAQAREGGRPRLASADLGAVFDQALLDLRLDVEATGAIISVDPLPIVAADGDLLYPVALNLLTNVLKFARPGQRPRARVHAERRPGAWRVHVTDRGIGVPAGREESVFRPYVRAHDGVEGHGIGLATVKRLVEAHGGSVGLGPSADGGTDVWFELPEGVAHAPR